MHAILEKLGRVLPLWYLVIYILLIPAFAGIYSLLEGGFYAPYAKLESSGQIDEAAVSEILLRMLKERVEPIASDIELKIFEVAFEPGEGSAIHYRVVAGVPTDDFKGVQLGGRLNHLVLFTLALNTFKRLDGPRLLINSYDFQTDEPKNDKAIENDIRAGLAVSWERPSKLEPADAQKIINFIAGYAGDPNGISQNFWRMAYFSVVTITTVGFGDIVPMTTTARTLVAMEAISGVILIGLFINALFQERRP